MSSTVAWVQGGMIEDEEEKEGEDEGRWDPVLWQFKPGNWPGWEMNVAKRTGSRRIAA